MTFFNRVDSTQRKLYIQIDTCKAIYCTKNSSLLINELLLFFFITIFPNFYPPKDDFLQWFAVFVSFWDI